MRFGAAKAVAAASAWGLSHVFRRPAANFPGKAALAIDPQLIAHLRPRIRQGNVLVCGTNGKTTVTNLLADALEADGLSVACNRTGANLDSGVASALLGTPEADWGVFECDELWLARVAPQLQPAYVVLLNLFRDQLDRMGEIALLQQGIANALRSSPATTLVYNADDPLCQAIADAVGNPRIPFGIASGMPPAADAMALAVGGAVPATGVETVSDAGMCPRCAALLAYRQRAYGQLGSYTCPQCGFAPSAPAYRASSLRHGAGSLRTEREGLALALRGGTSALQIETRFEGAYMAYNVLAAYAAADCCGVAPRAFEQAVRSFDPHNGRLQRYRIAGVDVLLNLAKNPVGFNQSIAVACAGTGPKAVAFFVNDREADGHDVSWLWDVDFQMLRQVPDLAVYAGGLRRNDVQVRLKYAGLNAQLVDDARDFLTRAHAVNPSAHCFAIANYTALPAVKGSLDNLQRTGAFPWETLSGPTVAADGEPQGASAASLPQEAPAGAASGEAPAGAVPGEVPTGAAPGEAVACETPVSMLPDERLKIAHLFPTLLNLYGDSGNVTILAERARRRGIDAQVMRIDAGDDFDLSDADLVFLGGGPDREQHKAALELADHADELRAFVKDDGVVLAICGGYQILGRTWLMGDETVAGLGVLDIETRRAPGNARNRLVGNIALRSPLATLPVLGYENHAGRTYLGAGCTPFGQVTGRHGYGNNGEDGFDGAIFRNVVGTYLHGPLLAKNPEVADWLIGRALARRAAKEGRPVSELAPLDDAVERAANAALCKRLGVR